MATTDSPSLRGDLHPSVYLTKTAPESSPVAYFVKNGKVHYYVVFGKDASGQEVYNSFSSKDQKALTDSISQLIHDSDDYCSEHRGTNLLKDAKIHTIKIPLDNASPIEIKRAGEPTYKALEPDQMNFLSTTSRAMLRVRQQWLRPNFIANERYAPRSDRYDPEMSFRFKEQCEENGNLRKWIGYCDELSCIDTPDKTAMRQAPKDYALSEAAFAFAASHYETETNYVDPRAIPLPVSSKLPDGMTEEEFTEAGGVTLDRIKAFGKERAFLDVKAPEATDTTPPLAHPFFYKRVVCQRLDAKGNRGEQESVGLYVDKENRKVYLYNSTPHELTPEQYPELFYLVDGMVDAVFPDAPDDCTRFIGNTDSRTNPNQVQLISFAKSLNKGKAKIHSIAGQEYNDLRYQLLFIHGMTDHPKDTDRKGNAKPNGEGKHHGFREFVNGSFTLTKVAEHMKNEAAKFALDLRRRYEYAKLGRLPKRVTS